MCLVFGWDGWWSVWWWLCVPCWLFVFLQDGPSVGSSRRGCIAAQQRLPCDGGVWRVWFPQPLLVRDAASPAFLSLRQVWVVYCCPLAPTRDVRARILPVARHLRRYVCSSRHGPRTTDTETAQAMDRSGYSRPLTTTAAASSMPRNSVGVAVMQGPTSGQCSCQIFMTAGTRHPQDPDPEEKPARTTVGSHGVRPDRHSSVRLPPPPPAGCTSVEVVGGWGCRFWQSAEGRGPRVTGGLCGVHLRALGGRLGGSPFASRRLLLHSSQPGRSLGQEGKVVHRSCSTAATRVVQAWRGDL